jgi:hypothetical protein
MITTNTGGLDIMSNLREQLCKLEVPRIGCIREDLRQAREGVISALTVYTSRRWDLGRALRAYKDYFKAEHAWMAAALKWISFEPWVSDPNTPLRKSVRIFARFFRRTKSHGRWLAVNRERATTLI